ncbi:hypothetical protein UVI_02013550 [Ustilaginoidea virens]|uniref:Uncharacterized protein n=1 Tax=Ustilaginoidea virens TaxID=1159556 RepID=A0A1B5KTQ5_USTVR|nr:hypothetical protein UVI_02013550 [Ustilaginoidea virens]
MHHVAQELRLRGRLNVRPWSSGNASPPPEMGRDHATSGSEDEESIGGSELTDGAADATIRRKPRARMPRKSTRYAVAQPAPQLRTKQRHLVQILPRLLLQLQEIGDKRAIPAFDLIPAQLVAGTLIIPKLAKHFPRIFHANAELSQNDVLLVRSEDYASTTPKHSSLHRENARRLRHDKEIIAVISAPSPKGRGEAAEIILEDGLPWSASIMANGSYEFTRIDEDGQVATARWVRRCHRTTGSSSTRSRRRDSLHESRWTFSIIDPSSRRHPILGSLTMETLEVYDSYVTLSTSSGRFPPSRPFGPQAAGVREQSTSSVSFSNSSDSQSRVTVEVLPAQKALMIATASWIQLQQHDWPASVTPKFAKVIPSSCRSPTPSGNRNSTPRRQTFPSYDGDGFRTTSPLDFAKSPNSTNASASSTERTDSGLPVRSMSTGRAFVKRRSDRMQGLSTVHSQEAPELGHGQGKLDMDRTEKAGCLGRVRKWTHRLLHRKEKDAPIKER